MVESICGLDLCSRRGIVARTRTSVSASSHLVSEDVMVSRFHYQILHFPFVCFDDEQQYLSNNRGSVRSAELYFMRKRGYFIQERMRHIISQGTHVNSVMLTLSI